MFFSTPTALFGTLIHLGLTCASASSSGSQEWAARLATSLNLDQVVPRSEAEGSDNAGARAEQACLMAQEAFPSTSIARANATGYLDASSESYLDEIQINWSSRCWLNSSCIVFPANAEDVSRVLSIVTYTQSKFSVRSGGHDFNPGHGGVGDDGLLMDLSNISSIQLSSDKSSVTVGAGAHWGDVYKVLNGTGVSMNGARSPRPGVGGQTLGGGIGWFPSAAGPTASFLTSAKVVLADSSIIEATEESYSDLLWALRGGGPNFGIVTSLSFKTLAVDKMWFAAWQYNASQSQELLEALVAYQEQAADEPNANIVYTLSENTAQPASFVGLQFSDTVSYPEVFNVFYNITPAATMIEPANGTLADLASFFSGTQYPEPGASPLRHYVVSLAHKVDLPTYEQTYEVFARYAIQANSSGWVMSYGSQPITLSAVDWSQNTPLGLESTPQDWVHITLQWESAEDDEMAMELMHNVGQDMIAKAEELGTHLKYRFMNDAYDGQDVLSSYGTENVEKLLQVSQVYDPEQYFQKLQNGGWLLSQEL